MTNVTAANAKVIEERTDPDTGEVYLIERAPFLVGDGKGGWVAEDVVELEGTRRMPDPQPKPVEDQLADLKAAIVGAKDLPTLKTEVAKLISADVAIEAARG